MTLAYLLEIPDAPTAIAWRTGGPDTLLDKATTVHDLTPGPWSDEEPLEIAAPIESEQEREDWLNLVDTPDATFTVAFLPEGGMWTTGPVIKGVVGTVLVGPAIVDLTIDRFMRIPGNHVWSDHAQRTRHAGDNGFSQSREAAAGALGESWPQR